MGISEMVRDTESAKLGLNWKKCRNQSRELKN